MKEYVYAIIFIDYPTRELVQIFKKESDAMQVAVTKAYKLLEDLKENNIECKWHNSDGLVGVTFDERNDNDPNKLYIECMKTGQISFPRYAVKRFEVY